MVPFEIISQFTRALIEISERLTAIHDATMIFAVAAYHLLSGSESDDLQGRLTGLRFGYSVIQTRRPRAGPAAVSETAAGPLLFPTDVQRFPRPR
jgi:2-keto-3-deoxy-galactonokinase